MCEKNCNQSHGHDGHNHNHGHNHSHSHSHHHHHHGAGNIGSAFFIIIELCGGLFANSTAILSDAIHDLGDTISLGVSWLLEKKSTKEADEFFAYGYGRYSILGSILNIIILTIGTILVLINSVPRLLNPQPVNVEGMLVLAVLGVLMNGMAVLKVKNGEKISERVVMLHLLEDVLGWVAVLTVSVILYFIDAPILDPILSLMISLYIMKNIVLNTKSIIKVILQKTPDSINIQELSKTILSNNSSVVKVDFIKCWSIDGESHVADLGITLCKGIDHEEIKKLKGKIRDEFSMYNIKQVTIEIN